MGTTTQRHSLRAVAGAVLIGGALVLTPVLAPSAVAAVSAAVTTTGEATISLREPTICGHDRDDTEWHFVITQVSSDGQAPASISVTWADGSTQTLPLEKVSGGTAHYRTTAHLDSTVSAATAVIVGPWDGNFNLSHGPACATTTTGTSTTGTSTTGTSTTGTSTTGTSTTGTSTTTGTTPSTGTRTTTGTTPSTATGTSSTATDTTSTPGTPADTSSNSSPGTTIVTTTVAENVTTTSEAAASTTTSTSSAVTTPPSSSDTAAENSGTLPQTGGSTGAVAGLAGLSLLGGIALLVAGRVRPRRH